ncbi:hypothetical protein DFH06DRAFT_1367299 [Mycena polygramma]|nr:hypothetical protein DFH06DRAFT_1367299 [Mycena polygramma]
MDTANQEYNEPAGVEPRLPPELECTIFEIAALTSPRSIPELMRVAQRVKACKQLTPRQVEGFPLIPRDLLLQAIREKPPSSGFFSSVVKHIYLDDPPGAAPLQLSDVETILAACCRCSDLFVAWSQASLRFVPVLNRLECLRRLTVDLRSLFEFTPIDSAQPFLRNLTHLELLDSYELSGHTAGLALLPHLTHVAFNDAIPSAAALHAGLQTNMRLQCIIFFSEEPVEPEAEDDRFVAIEQTDFQLDWIRGATGGRDHWALADSFIAAKRAGRLDRSFYWISDEDNSDWTTSCTPLFSPFSIQQHLFGGELKILPQFYCIGTWRCSSASRVQFRPQGHLSYQRVFAISNRFTINVESLWAKDASVKEKITEHYDELGNIKYVKESGVPPDPEAPGACLAPLLERADGWRQNALQHSMELHPCVRRHAIYILAIVLLPLAPAALEPHLGHNALRAISWACTKVTQGLASGAFALTMWMVCWLARDAFVWLICARGVAGKTIVELRTPAELEDGGMRDLALLKIDSTVPTPTRKPKPLTTLDKLITILVTTTFFFYAFLTAEETLATTLAYILGGWVVLAIGFVLLVLRKLPEAMRQQRCLDEQLCTTETLADAPPPENADGEVEEKTTEKVQACATH